ncbi:hypothetical protein FQN54_008483 [Arachnomyces sp. PD_36]|nr:hypothetical protein FQN54_008483 [Arachnomyces sp. PD_36]
MTFGYNANVTFGNTIADITDQARCLLTTLIDKREEPDEARRPIVFIGYSLGGIIVKEALLQSKIDERYSNISDSTAAIVFLGTPHHGSKRAPYGKVLATIAKTTLNMPWSRLARALKANSEALLRLNSKLRFQLPDYQIFSFYETRPIKGSRSPVVDKSSALLNIKEEEQIPVDTDQEGICKFANRDDEVYEMIFKRIRRALRTVKSCDQTRSHIPPVKSCNKHYYVPYNLSGIFTGQEDVMRKLRSSCLRQDLEDRPLNQKRFVLYGLGGSGKTQTCLKFAQDHRDSFWGIFWVDATSRETAEEDLIDIGLTCGIEEDVAAVKQWLSNAQDYWLMIIDNAGNGWMEMSEFFPTGNRGTILITSRNPGCKIQSTVGSCEMGRMDPEEAQTLFLRASGVEDLWDDTLRKKASPVVDLLGHLALAIVRAGACVLNGHCTMDECCSLYTHHRERLLYHSPSQARFDYRYSVSTTWEVSVKAIEGMSGETSENSLELLRILCFLHHDNVPEDIFRFAWENINKERQENITEPFYMRSQERGEWNPRIIRNAAAFLERCSLAKFDVTNRCMSMHPLVQVWGRDRLSDDLRNETWAAASFTLAAAMPRNYKSSDRSFCSSLVPHVDTCISLRQPVSIIDGDLPLDQDEIAARFASVYAMSGQLQVANGIEKTFLEARRGDLNGGSPDTNTLSATSIPPNSQTGIGHVQLAWELREKVLEERKQILSEEAHDAVPVTDNLAAPEDNLVNGEDVRKPDLSPRLVEVNDATNDPPDTPVPRPPSRKATLIQKKAKRRDKFKRWRRKFSG